MLQGSSWLGANRGQEESLHRSRSAHTWIRGCRDAAWEASCFWQSPASHLLCLPTALVSFRIGGQVPEHPGALRGDEPSVPNGLTPAPAYTAGSKGRDAASKSQGVQGMHGSRAHRAPWVGRAPRAVCQSSTPEQTEHLEEAAYPGCCCRALLLGDGRAGEQLPQGKWTPAADTHIPDAMHLNPGAAWGDFGGPQTALGWGSRHSRGPWVALWCICPHRHTHGSPAPCIARCRGVRGDLLVHGAAGHGHGARSTIGSILSPLSPLLHRSLWCHFHVGPAL